MMRKLSILLLVSFLSICNIAKAQVSANFIATPSAVGCAPLVVNLSDTNNTTDVVLYYWLLVRHFGTTVDSIRPTSTTSSLHLSLANPGYYTVYDSTRDITTSHSSALVKKDSFLYVTPNLNIDFATLVTKDTFSCKNTHITFVNNSDSLVGCNMTYVWTINGPDTATIYTTHRTDTPAFTFVKAGTYDVSLRVLSSCSGSCNGSFSIKRGYITIDSLPVINFNSPNTALCSSPVNVTFNNTTSGADSFYWHFGDGGASLSGSPIHNYHDSGYYNITLTAYSPNAHCAATKIVDSFIHIGPRKFGYTIKDTFGTAKSTFCQGEIVVLRDTTTLLGAHFTWSDNASVTDTSTTNSAKFIYLLPGTYTIIDSVYSSGCYGTATKNITINPAPNVAISVDSFFKCSTPLTVHFNSIISSGTSPYTYSWFFGDSTVHDTSTSPTPTHTYRAMPILSPTPPFVGNFTDTLIVKDANGCSTFGYFQNVITIGEPIFNVKVTLDSGCTPFRFIYNTWMTPISSNGVTDSIPFIIDSIAFTNDTTFIDSAHFGGHPIDSGYSVRNSHIINGAGAYNDVVTFYYRLPKYLGGCTYSNDSTIIHVGGIHPIMTGITISADTVCPNSPVTFTSGCSNCDNFEWKFGNLGIPAYHIVNDTTVAFPIPGTYRIFAIGDVGGCTDTLKLHDTVVVKPPVKSASIIITQTNCNGTDFSFVGAAVPVAGFTTYYYWDFGDGTTTVAGATASHHYSLGEATYNVLFIDSINNSYHCKNIDSAKVFAYSFSDAREMYPQDTLACFGKSLSFFGPNPTYNAYGTGADSFSYAQYIWHWGDGTVTSSTISSASSTIVTSKAAHIYSVSGNYADTLITKNLYGCYDTIFYGRNTTVINAHQKIHVGGPQPGGFKSLSPIAGCASLTVSFADSTTDAFSVLDSGINRRYWLFNGSPTVSGTTVPTVPILGTGIDTTYTFPEGVFHVVLIDSDGVGCFVRDTIVVSSQKVHAYFTTNENTLHPGVYGCIGHQYTFNDTNTHSHYFWKFGDGSTSTLQNPTHAYSATGTYSVTVAVTADGTGTISAGCTDTFKTFPPIKIHNMNTSYFLTGDTAATCPPLYVIGTNTTIPDTIGGYEFYWKITPIGEILDSFSTPENLYTTVNTPGTVSTITLLAKNPIGCMDSASQTVHIYGPAGVVTVSNPSGCAPMYGNTITFTDTNHTVISNVTWYPGDGSVVTTGAITTDSTSQIVHSYLNVGLYHPYLFLDGGGCGSVLIPDTTLGHFSDSIRVFKLVDSIRQPRVLCYGSSTVLRAYGAGAGGSYLWITDSAVSCPTCDSITVSPTHTTIYRVAINTTAGCFDTLTTTLVVDTPHAVSITGMVAGNAFCFGLSDTLHANNVGSRDSILWSPSGVLSCDTCLTIVAAPMATTTIWVTLKDTMNCMARDSIRLQVNPIPTLSSVADTAVCDSALLVYVPMSGDSLATYNWSRASVPGISNTGRVGVDTIKEYLHDITDTSVNVVYTFTVTALGCSSDTSIKVTVHPTPRLTSARNESICSLAPFYYTDSSSTAGVTFTWHRDTVAGLLPVTSAGTGAIADTITNAGTTQLSTYFYIMLTANGCSHNDSVKLTVNPTPILSSSHTVATVCNDGAINYTAASTMANSTYKWSRATVAGISSGAGLDTGKTISENLMDTAHSTIMVVYVYTLSANGCTSDTNHVEVSVRPTSKLSSVHSDTLCSGATFSYTPSSATTDALSYTWNHPAVTGLVPLTVTSGTGGISDVLAISVDNPVLTKYYYTLSDSGCTNTDSVSVLVIHQPDTSIFIIDDLGGATTNICTNSNYRNFHASQAPAAGTAFVWSSTNAVIARVGSTSQYCLVDFTTAASNVFITINSGLSGIGCYVNNNKHNTYSVNTSVSDTPTVLYFENNLYCLRNDEASYQWGYDDKSTLEGFEITGQTFQNYFIPSFADSAVNRYYWVKTTNNDGCKQKTYANAPNVSVSNLYSNTAKGIMVYPNPASEAVNVQVLAPFGSEVKLEVYNLLGQKLVTKEATNNKATISIEGLADGSYFMVSYINGAKSASTTFIKK